MAASYRFWHVEAKEVKPDPDGQQDEGEIDINGIFVWVALFFQAFANRPLLLAGVCRHRAAGSGFSFEQATRSRAGVRAKPLKLPVVWRAGRLPGWDGGKNQRGRGCAPSRQSWTRVG